MIACFDTDKKEDSLPILFINVQDFPQWLSTQSDQAKRWLSVQFKPQAGNSALVPDDRGKLTRVICCVAEENNLWEAGQLPLLLPEGHYFFELENERYEKYAIAWGLGGYQFTRYKKPLRLPAQLYLPKALHKTVINIVESLYFVRDLINTPTDDLGPSQFAEAAVSLAEVYGATTKQIVAEDLLKENYPLIYTVGRASDDPPRLLDLRWGNTHHPKVTLVGKGVCFDTGGLDLKPAAYMALMKKDMAGGAHALGLARMIMQAKLPVSLRVLVPMVENAIGGNAYRPGDVIKSRSGKTIEVGNTDAEGRLVLADALSEAASEKPQLLIDLSTLTGAARVALGTELPAVFSNRDLLVEELIQVGEKEFDPMWRLPLFAAYREFLNSPIADMNNNPSEPYGGAITAALFLQSFVPDEIPWLHFDMMAWNLRARPGRPIGGDAVALRALFSWLKDKFINNS